MQLVTRPIEWLTPALEKADSVVIASAYFHPKQEILTKLEQIQDVRVIVSGEFDVNNPTILRNLAATADVRVVMPDSEQGRLHAKVIICRSGGTTRRFALVGSANFTYQGLFKHREVCISLDSRKRADREVLNQLDTWIEELPAEVPDWDRAIRTYERARQQRSVLVPGETPRHCWVLKTTEGVGGPSHWCDFKDEGVLAVGWATIGSNPEQYSREQLRSELNDSIASQVWSFIHEWHNGDLVLICRGYNAQQETDVDLLGFARVTGEFIDDATSTWSWRYKRRAFIQPVEQRIPKRIYVETLGKRTMLRTIHALSYQEFTQFLSRVENEFGISRHF
jgi:HKD family nuclease